MPRSELSTVDWSPPSRSLEHSLQTCVTIAHWFTWMYITLPTNHLNYQVTWNVVLKIHCLKTITSGHVVHAIIRCILVGYVSLFPSKPWCGKMLLCKPRSTCRHFGWIASLCLRKMDQNLTFPGFVGLLKIVSKSGNLKSIQALFLEKEQMWWKRGSMLLF